MNTPLPARTDGNEVIPEAAPAGRGGVSSLPRPLLATVGFVVLLALRYPVSGADWQAGPGYRWRETPVAASGKTGFTQLPASATGITFTNHLSDAAAAKNRILENGSGVALGDVDGDGWCDVYFCQLEGPNVLYRNLGTGRFEDITAAAGVACADQPSTGAVLADLDGDGDLDLLVNAIGNGTRLFLNDGRGHFSEPRDTGLFRRLGGTSMALADFDGDGDLDLYVTNYRTDTLKDSPPGLKPEARMVNGRIVVTPEDRFTALSARAGGVTLVELGEPDVLYRNEGRGRFSAVAWTDGTFVDEDGKALTQPPRHWGLSVMFRDFNGDGWPDLYVCNDFFMSPDQFWLNEGGRRFRAIPRLAWRNMSMSAMAVDVADINRDGHDDFFVADMLSRDHGFRQRQRANVPRMREVNPPVMDVEFRPEFPRNTLQLNRGDGTYAEIAQFAGLEASEWSWSAVFVDVDLDGYEDLLITTGNLHDVLDADTMNALATPGGGDPARRHLSNLLRFPRLETPLLAFRNRADLTFEEAGSAWGLATPGIAHGMALADLDHDGDPEVIVNRLNQAAGIYRNESVAPRVAVRLRGRAPNTQGIGARIKVLGGPVTQTQSVIGGGRYLSGDDPVRVFAAGSLTNALTIEVTWPGGRRSVVTGARPNRIYEIDEAGDRVPEAAPATDPVAPPWFRDVSDLIGHQHVDELFDDFQRQPLLSHRLSQLGPGVTWFDVDADGWEDLVIGTGKGGKMGVFQNRGPGGFRARESAALAASEVRDQTTILGWRDRTGQALLLAGSANYEDASTNGALLRIFNLQQATALDGFRARAGSVGPLAMGDIDGDGDLDLLVGGRVLAGAYPAPVSSIIFRNEAGRFRPDVENSQRLARLGLVSGAVFSDVDGDGDVDLVLACDWGPVRVFRNDGGRLTEVTTPLGLARYAGCWKGVTTGDFDGDGRLDIVASNSGRNTRAQAHRAQPLRAYWGDLDGNGTVEVVETYFDPGLNKQVPWVAFDALSPAVPWVQEQVTSHRAYGRASVAEILGARFAAARELTVETLDSLLFLNRGDHFLAVPLPAEAQFAPAFAVTVGDADGDGREDVFLSQNFFGVELETARQDAGRGLWLRGDGRGGLRPVSGAESGVRVDGEQRGAALCDYDHDGRVDLVVAQNRGATRLFQNVGARPGLRVRLEGPPENPLAVGATIRLTRGPEMGPAREIHAGSGYWSQDSAIQVMALSEAPTGVWVRWPGGKTTTSIIPSGAREVVVDSRGGIRSGRSAGPRQPAPGAR